LLEIWVGAEIPQIIVVHQAVAVFIPLYIYSLQPPLNTNKFDALAERGQKIFQRERCVTCHTPPLYTSNELTPAEGFTVHEDHTRKYDILPMSVGTDPNLALKTTLALLYKRF
jgi:CxxC motif-containing protein (DUF1111 family)